MPPSGSATDRVRGPTNRPSPFTNTTWFAAKRFSWTSTRPLTIARFLSRTTAISIPGADLFMPNSSSRCAYQATLAECTMFLLGRQAMLGQEPPTYRLSMSATLFPSAPKDQLRYFPASPLPRTRASNTSTVWCVLSGIVTPWSQFASISTSLHVRESSC
ncbi:hypothetical protein ACPOL_7023 (plasmid) [Acidisarcina polymorpha]|uniref:Uncharacterized protein n=1 Tax=Acidisarcina polymorpha TaxID=2211140 RepID=A0A2Z5GAJ5_9BACT|nr:hypothetical protein ACPOL_7023 [Acidisarcina polymorpha]